jgi:hypothetical protein
MLAICGVSRTCLHTACGSHDASTHSLPQVRGTVLASKAAAADAAAARAAQLLDGSASFPQLCRQLPAAAVRPCLQQLSELLFEIVASYQLMAEFHEANQQAQAQQKQQHGEQQQQQQQGGGADGGQMEAVQAATRGLLQAVAGALRAGRAEVADAAAVKLRELLLVPEMARGDEVMQV